MHVETGKRGLPGAIEMTETGMAMMTREWIGTSGSDGERWTESDSGRARGTGIGMMSEIGGRGMTGVARGTSTGGTGTMVHGGGTPARAHHYQERADGETRSLEESGGGRERGVSKWNMEANVDEWTKIVLYIVSLSTCTTYIGAMRMQTNSKRQSNIGAG